MAENFVSSAVWLLVIFGFLALFLHWVARKRALFALDGNHWNGPHWRFWQVAILFLLYIFVASMVAPLVMWLFKGSAHGGRIAIAQWITVGGTGLLFWLFSMTLARGCAKAAWKNERGTKVIDDIAYGALYWVISLPVVIVTDQVFELLNYFAFDFTGTDQLAVRYLRNSISDPFFFATALVAIVLGAPFIEEFLFRGCLQGWLRNALGPRIAVITTSLCFAFFHYAPAQKLGNVPIIASLFILSLYIGWVYEKRRSLWAPISLHFIFNGTSVLYILRQIGLFALIPCFVCANWHSDTALFGERLRAEIGESNQVLSPLATRIALLMAYTGAAGETEVEMRRALCIGDEVLPPGPMPHVKTSVWIDGRLSPLSTFTEASQEGFGATLHPTSFIDPRSAVDAINAWAETPLLGPGDLSAEMRLLFAAKLHYKGAWQTPFDGKKTALRPFYTKNGVKSVPTMRQTAPLLYADMGHQQVVALPFADTAALVITLPREGKVATAVDYALLRKMQVRLELPRFRLKSRLALNRPLSALGMPSAFGAKADFSGITGDTSLKIAKVMAEAVLEVDEAGASVAAATSVSMGVTSLLPGIAVEVNRPFRVALVDMETKTPLALGDVCTL